jgi:hypothetical protein
MALYSVEELIKQAKVAIDENTNSQSLTVLGDVDTLTLDEIIRSKVEDAARLVESAAAHELLDAGKPFAASVTWENDVPGYGAGRTTLPSDFMRLVTFRMSDWYRPVTEAITEEHPAYMMQSSRYAGVRGNPQRPVVAIVHGEAGQVLEFYCCSAGPGVRVSVARHLPLPTINEDDEIDLCPKLERAVVYRLASMTCAIIGASDLAAMLLGTSNELAGIVTTA